MNGWMECSAALFVRNSIPFRWASLSPKLNLPFSISVSISISGKGIPPTKQQLKKQSVFQVSHIAVSLGGRPMLHLNTFSISPFHCLNLTPVDCPILKLPTRRSDYTKPRAVVVKASTRHYSAALKSEARDDNYYQEIEEEEVATNDFSSSGSGYGRREGETKYDRDPEFADIVGSFVDDPQKARSKVEERLKKKRNKILHAKTGSAEPMRVKFNKFDFSNSYIWFEFYNSPLEKDVSLISDTIRSWHIVGRLGGCNSMNMQLSQSPLDKKPSYDAIQGANVTPTTFYNIGDLEVQDNLARVWVDIGTTEPLLLDVLINALTQISSDYIGIKQLVFGGSEFEQWKDGLTSEEAGCSTHKI